MVTVISASFGSGHDVAARELARRLESRGMTTRTYDFVDLLGKIGPWARGAYAWQLTHAPATWGWTLDLLRDRSGVDWCARFSTQRAGIRILDVVQGSAAVVSTYPLASLVLGQLRLSDELCAPVITYITDLSVHPLWVSPGVDLHLAPHDRARVEARNAGAGAISLSAPAVNRDRFHPVTGEENRKQLRQKYGLPLGGRLALVSSGSWGVGAVAATARDVARTGRALPVIACGRNEQLRRTIFRRRIGPALGWVNDMNELIRACDVVITNAGGLTGVEAIASGVPLIAYRSLPGHGVTNADALHETGLGVRADNLEQLAELLVDPRPASVGPYQLARPNAIFDFPDPAELIIEQVREPAPSVRVPQQRIGVTDHEASQRLAGVA